MDKLERSFITGFEKDNIWVNITQDRTYQFFNDGTGVILDSNLKSSNLKWELINKGETSVIKIGLNGSIYYYIFKNKKSKKEFIAIRKTKNEESNISFILQQVKKDNNSSNISEPKEKESLKQNYNYGVLNNVDKIFLAIIFFIIFIFLIIMLKMTEILGSLPMIGTIILPLILSGVILFYLRIPFLYISKKYKKEMEDLFIKK